MPRHNFGIFTSNEWIYIFGGVMETQEYSSDVMETQEYSSDVMKINIHTGTIMQLEPIAASFSVLRCSDTTL